MKQQDGDNDLDRIWFKVNVIPKINNASFLFHFVGFIIDFVSEPVASGFTSAVALIIVGTQIKDLLGIKVDGSTFVKILQSTFSQLSDVKKWDLLLGLVCITFLISLRVSNCNRIIINSTNLNEKFSPKQFLARYSSTKTNVGSVKKKFFYKIVWCIGMFRNAILVILCMGVGYYFKNVAPEVPFRLTGILMSLAYLFFKNTDSVYPFIKNIAS